MNSYNTSKKFNECIFFLLKFGQRKNIESFQNGNLYMNNLQYFINMEKEKAKKGMGDINEGKLVLNNIDFKSMHPETDEVFFVGYSEVSKLEITEDNKKPVFCMSCIDINSLKIYEETESSLQGKLVFSEKQKKEFIEEFGDTLLIISYSDFINRISCVFKEKNIKFLARKVEYNDYSTNYINRINSFNKQNGENLFWKDIFFEYQNEFRIAILNCDVKDKLEIDIGNIKSFSKLVSTKEFLNKDFSIRVNYKGSEPSC